MSITFDFACQDDCLDQMAPSDLRLLILERDRAQAELADAREVLRTYVGQTVFIVIDLPDYGPSRILAVYSDRELAERETKRMRNECEEYEKRQRIIEGSGEDGAWLEAYPAPRFPMVQEFIISGLPNAQADLAPASGAQVQRLVGPEKPFTGDES